MEKTTQQTSEPTAPIQQPNPIQHQTQNQAVPGHVPNPKSLTEVIKSKVVTTLASDKNLPILPQATELLRLQLINAGFHHLKNSNVTDAYAVVTVGNVYAKTNTRSLLPIQTEKEGHVVSWNEHFAIEYEAKDDKSNVLIQVFDPIKKELLGEYKVKISDIEPPKKKKSHQEGDEHPNWDTSKILDVSLKSSHHSQAGNLVFRIRRELKMYGTMTVQVKEISLCNPVGQSSCIKCITKLLDQHHESPIIESQNRTLFTFSTPFTTQLDVNGGNHVFDAFVEIWQVGKESRGNDFCILLGQVRISLFDAQSDLCATLSILDVDHKQLGHAKIEAKLDGIQSPRKADQSPRKSSTSSTDAATTTAPTTTSTTSNAPDMEKETEKSLKQAPELLKTSTVETKSE